MLDKRLYAADNRVALQSVCHSFYKLIKLLTPNITETAAPHSKYLGITELTSLCPASVEPLGT